MDTKWSFQNVSRMLQYLLQLYPRTFRHIMYMYHYTVVVYVTS
jgi:hypothetical protein